MRGGDPQRMSRKRLLNARKQFMPQAIHVRQHNSRAVRRNSFIYDRQIKNPEPVTELRIFDMILILSHV